MDNLDEAILQPGATSDRDGPRPRSIAAVVPDIKAQRPSLTQDNVTLCCHYSLASLPL
jgi:hypothetical protein